MRERLVGNVTFPLTNYFFNRRNILTNYRGMREAELWPREKIAATQAKRLRDLLGYAYAWIPFYRRRMEEAGMKPGDIKEIGDIAALPPLTRQEVIDHRHELVDQRFRDRAVAADGGARGAGLPVPLGRLRKSQVVRNTSSGSTGAPTVFYEDGARTAMNWACELRYKKWFDVDPGAGEARFARVSVDYLPRGRETLFRRYLWNQLMLPGVNLGEKEYELCRRQLIDFRPRVLWGFTSALAGLADYLLSGGVEPLPFRPKLVMTWAAPLYEHEERTIGRAFGCAVTNIYGARETGHIGCRCPEGTLHVNEEWLLVEEEEGGTERGPEGSGELLVTNLDVTIMPFIRYRMGDLGSLSTAPCRCGRTLASIPNLLGRTGEIFFTASGQMISPNFWCRTFMNPRLGGRVMRFQVLYQSPERILIRIVRGKDYTEETERVLREGLQRNFPPPMQTAFSYVEEIKPQVSGKYQMVINESGRQSHVHAH